VLQRGKDPLISLIEDNRAELEGRIVAAELRAYIADGSANPELKASTAAHVSEGLSFVVRWTETASMDDSHAFFAGMLGRSLAQGISPAQVIQLVDLVTGEIITLAREKLRGMILSGVVQRLETGAAVGKAVVACEIAKDQHNGSVRDQARAAR